MLLKMLENDAAAVTPATAATSATPPTDAAAPQPTTVPDTGNTKRDELAEPPTTQQPQHERLEQPLAAAPTPAAEPAATQPQPQAQDLSPQTPPEAQSQTNAAAADTTPLTPDAATLKQQEEEEERKKKATVEQARYSERTKLLRTLFSDPQPGEDTTPAAQEGKKFAAVMGLVTRDRRLEFEEFKKDPQIHIQRYAAEVLHLPPGASLDEIHAAGKQRMGKEIAREDTWMDGAKAALTGQDMIPAWLAWQKAHPESAEHSPYFMSAFQETRKRSGAYLELAGDFLNALEVRHGMQRKGQPQLLKGGRAKAVIDDIVARSSTEGFGPRRFDLVDDAHVREFNTKDALTAGTVIDGIVDELEKMEPEERKQVYAIMTAHVEAAGYDVKGFWAQTDGYLDKMFSRAASTLETQWKSFRDLPWSAMAEGGEGMTPEHMDAAAERIAKHHRRGEIVGNEIQPFVLGVLDPVRPTVGWLNDSLEEGLIKAPGAVLPSLLVTAVAGPWVGAAVLTLDYAEQNRRNWRAMGVDDTRATEMGMVAAPLQAGVEMLSNLLHLGRFPAVQRTLSRFTAPVGGASLLGRYGLNTLVNGGVEFTEEHLQENVILPAVQNIAAAFDKDVPHLGIGQIFDNIKKTSPELFFTLLPGALVFGGMMTAADARLSASMVDSQDFLQAAGYSAAQANEVRLQPTLDGKITKARELWGLREGQPQSIQAAAENLRAQMRQLSTDTAARVRELEQRGILPRMLHLAQGDQWRLTFNDGSTADFNSHAEADAARWQWTGDQFGHVHAATREALASLERNLPALREVAVRIDPHTREVTRAEAEQSTSIQDRMAQGRLFGELPPTQLQQPQQIDSGLDDAAALATAEGVPTEVVARILGSSRNHHDAKTGILTTTIRLYEGADVLTLVEEKLEGDAKVILATPAGRDWMLTHLRAYEQSSGEKLFTIPADGHAGAAANATNDAQLTDAMLVEAWSHLGQSYLVGSSSHGAPARGGRLRGFLDSLMQSGLGGLMGAQSTYWGAVAARAQKLVDLKREGKLGSDLTAELERQLGLGEGMDSGINMQPLTQSPASLTTDEQTTSPDNSAGQSSQPETFSLAARNELEQQTALPLDQRFASIPSGPELRSTTRDYFRDHLMTLAGDQLPVTRDGRVVHFTMTGFKEMRQHSADPRVLQMLPSMPEMLRKAVPIFSESNTESNRPNIRAYHHYAIKSTLGGEEFYARLVVREDDSGESHYDADATSVLLFKESGEQSPHQPDRKPNAGEDKAALAKGRLYQWWHSVNTDSKYSPPSSGINQAAPVIQEDDAGPVETHSLAAPPDNTDPRLRDVFHDWKHGWDEEGFPQPPKTLPDGHPLLQPTADKKTVSMSANHPLVRAGLLPADQEMPRKAMHAAIIEHLIRQASPLPSGKTPTIYALGGGGGAGKSTLLEQLMERGLADERHLIRVDADEIKKLIPEYLAAQVTGDARASSSVQLESARIADSLLKKLLERDAPKYDIIFDSTLANVAGNLRRIADWKAAGLRVHLIGVTIDPKEAAVRATIRAPKEGRWVPAAALTKAHQGFNEALKHYLPQVDAADIYDNSSSDFTLLVKKNDSKSGVLLVNPQFWHIIEQRSHAPQTPSR